MQAMQVDVCQGDILNKKAPAHKHKAKMMR